MPNAAKDGSPVFRGHFPRRSRQIDLRSVQLNAGFGMGHYAVFAKPERALVCPVGDRSLPLRKFVLRHRSKHILRHRKSGEFGRRLAAWRAEGYSAHPTPGRPGDHDALAVDHPREVDICVVDFDRHGHRPGFCAEAPSGSKPAPTASSPDPSGRALRLPAGCRGGGPPPDKLPRPCRGHGGSGPCPSSRWSCCPTAGNCPG